jgi:hypothetical protein
VREDLRRFKSLMEAGEVPTLEGQPAGKRARSPANGQGNGQRHGS